jgi:AraC-like DNA-binding protein
LGVDSRLLFDDRSRITVDQASAMIRELWALTDDELFGLGPSKAPRGTFRMLSLAVLSAPDLGAVLDRWSQFSRVVTGLPVITVHKNDDCVRVEVAIDPERDPTHFMVDISLAVTVRFLGWLIGRRLLVDQVLLPYPTPEHPQDYEIIFGPNVAFDQPTAAFVIRTQILGLPTVRDEKAVEQWLRQAPQDLLNSREHDLTVAGQVRHLLERGLRGDWMDADAVASRLAMSTQHLRRVLRDEGTSISTLKEELLRDAAIASLVRGDESITALSTRLGFSEPSAFYRAFKRWTGNAPGSYRPGSGEADK